MMITKNREFLCLLTAAALLLFSGQAAVFGAAFSSSEADDGIYSADRQASSRSLIVVEDEPDTVDFQCTTVYYTVAANVFDRLVEMGSDGEGGMKILPSLAESFEISEDGCSYSFHLRPDISFSNGSPLTSSDVLYSFTRLLTHKDSSSRDIVEGIEGAFALERGETDKLEGFQIVSDQDFVITLSEPFAAFLACLSMPAASILDEETTEKAGDRFGLDVECTVGTGPFILKEWVPGKGMLLKANPECWSGPPASDGLEWRFLTEPEEVRKLFDNGELDILDLDDLNMSADYYLHGDIYQSRLEEVSRVSINFIALNGSVSPLDDPRVRRALQLSLDRSLLLDIVYGGKGRIENGIFPFGLYGHDPELPEIPCDTEGAKKLLKEAGYPDGFDLTFSIRSSSSQSEMELAEFAAAMWEKAGIRVEIDVIDEEEFMSRRKNGELASYLGSWMADYNDPDNFLYPFFGNRENTDSRSLCYQDEEIMERVRKARSILDEETRIREYQELERIIIQEDAAWIPLFSRFHYYVLGENLEGFRTSWNGSVKNNYRYMYVSED